MHFKHVLAAALLAVLASPGFAQDDPTACWDRMQGGDPANTFLNKQMSDYWRQILQAADTGLMGRIAGVYYGERPSPDGVYVNRQYRSFEASGLFQYKDQTCTVGSSLPCSQNQGTGEWRAVNQTDGSTYLMARFSDLDRSNACFGDRITLQSGGIQDEGGVFWQRTQ
jgi:hypothetical protein